MTDEQLADANLARASSAKTQPKKRKIKRPAAEAGELQEFKKTNEAIGLRVVEGSLTLLSRKLFNVMLYHAQKAREPGVGAPINTPTSKKYFWIRLSELARDAAYDSRDTQYLKEILQGMQDIKLLMETDRQWTSERLVSSITLVNPEGLNKHSGQVWLGYAFPPEVHEQVMAPSQYTRLSIVYQSSLRSGPALALYEICRRYATNPSKRTAANSVEHWHSVLTGTPIDVDNPPVYKYFKRDVLKPAIAEVNALTDITVELVEHKSGRRVERIQFMTEHSKQTHLEFPAQPIVDLEVIERIASIGFSHADASDLAAQYPKELVAAAISRLEARMSAKGMSPLSSPAGYFRWQLGELAKNPPETPVLSAVPAPVSGKRVPVTSVMDRFLSARAAEALDVYKNLDDKERCAVFDDFKEQNSNSVVKHDKGIESAIVRAQFSRWYATLLWGEPSAEALAKFIEESSVHPG